ncbi:hypothetical protein HELRODRAFT_83682 [Helobdella robusta]|uniref:RING-type domain-containing protein n=1 Tax=Helobdella robusta TaxID=6412 RepID=T1G591_HELRO|nr:hypothetical protein HELRODRAFT_83682 [Helobdella robusta]ESN99957.1 hypothetical protein HELRODRAFT_83682 [Helobdella robusta]
MFLSEECPVCLDEFQEGVFIFELPCRHCIHAACSSDWFKQRPVCPICIRALSVSIAKHFKFSVTQVCGGRAWIRIELTTEPGVDYN